MSYLHTDKQERLRKFHRREDMWRGLTADLLVRTVICNDLGIKNSDLDFATNEYGKPFLRSFYNYKFNLSHSGNWVVCATNRHPVGIDIEYIQPIDFNIAKRFFSMEEYSALLNLKSSSQLSYFYDLWTLKESYIKAVGKGLYIPLDSFTCQVKVNGDITIKSCEVTQSIYFRQYHIDNGYKLSVCGFVEEFTDDVEKKELSDLCDDILSI